LVKVGPEGKYICEIDQAIDQKELKTNLRVALRSDSYALYKILPSKVDPLVSLMRVEKVPDSSYDTIGGLDKQIKEIKEVVELPIKHPEIFESLGIAQPKGVLLYGPPGTGKTLLARAVAHHTDCCFIRVSGSELVQKYIGEGSRMVRELFIMAREHAPSIIFMDEVRSRVACVACISQHLMLSILRLIPSVPLVVTVVLVVVIVKCSAQCWSF
jgi:26S proteasome regulatory subunit T6